MKCFSLVAATTVAALFLAVGVADTAAPTFPTTITFDAFTGPDEVPRTACGRQAEG